MREWPEEVERCFRAQAPKPGSRDEKRANAAALFDLMTESTGRGPHRELSMRDVNNIVGRIEDEHAARPNLLLWNGRAHCLVFSLKYDYVPVQIRREARTR